MENKDKTIKREYDKSFLDISEQINLLKSRGLIIEDEEEARYFLRNVSYYHLSAYTKAFQESDNEDRFKDQTTFKDVLDLYNFDKKLRLLLLDLLERIEMSFKYVLAYELTNAKGKNIYWYADRNNFDSNEKVDRFFEDLKSRLKESKEIYISHFYQKYSNPFPPAWIFFESLTFGECSLLSRNLCDNDTQIIAGFYGLSKRGTIQMLHYLSHLRNLCAHHSRVWNKEFTIKISKYKRYNDVFGDSSSSSLYAYLVVAQIFLLKISPTFGWIEKLKDLIDKYNIPLYRMGFPEDWYERLSTMK